MGEGRHNSKHYWTQNYLTNDQLIRSCYSGYPLGRVGPTAGLNMMVKRIVLASHGELPSASPQPNIVLTEQSWLIQINTAEPKTEQPEPNRNHEKLD